MSISCNWFGFESHNRSHLSGVCYRHWLGTRTEKSKAGNEGVPTNLSTASSGNTKSKSYYIVQYSDCNKYPLLSPIICRIIYV